MPLQCRDDLHGQSHLQLPYMEVNLKYWYSNSYLITGTSSSITSGTQKIISSTVPVLAKLLILKKFSHHRYQFQQNFWYLKSYLITGTSSSKTSGTQKVISSSVPVLTTTKNSQSKIKISMVIAMYILNNYACLYFFNYICIRFRKIPQLDNVFKYCKIYVFIYKKYFLGKYILALSFPKIIWKKKSFVSQLTVLYINGQCL